jgi:hypothetical protein
MPAFPRGPRKIQSPRSELILGCPRIAPDWELGALAALMKPQRKQKILHREPTQPWPRDAATRVGEARRLVVERIRFDLPIDLPLKGDYLLIATIRREQLPQAVALAVVLSHALPGVWFELGRIFIRDGGFFRRERGKKFRIVPTASLHVRRDLRAALRPVL